jgi:phosphonate transport system substrate-binding protein
MAHDNVFAMALTFAMGPFQRDEEEGDELRDRFAEQLGKALETEVHVHIAHSYTDVRSSIARGDAQLAWLPPAIYVQLERESGAHLLAAIDRGQGAGYRGVLFVRHDAAIHTPEALEGERVAWVDPFSCAGYLFPRLALRARGLAGVFSEERFLGSHGSVVHAVQRGDVAAGATFGQIAESVPGAPSGITPDLAIAGWYPYAGAGGMRPVLVTDPIPSDVICASKRALDVDALDEVREALLHLHENGGSEIIDELFGGPRLIAAHTTDYDTVRAAVG